jgi:hypothetical protein
MPECDSRFTTYTTPTEGSMTEEQATAIINALEGQNARLEALAHVVTAISTVTYMALEKLQQLNAEKIEPSQQEEE